MRIKMITFLEIVTDHSQPAVQTVSVSPLYSLFKNLSNILSKSSGCDYLFTEWMFGSENQVLRSWKFSKTVNLPWLINIPNYSAMVHTFLAYNFATVQSRRLLGGTKRRNLNSLIELGWKFALGNKNKVGKISNKGGEVTLPTALVLMY